MARLSEEKVLIVFTLQRTLLERLDEATGTEFELLEQYGETGETIPELDELQNIRERANTYYSRFYTTLRQIYLSQPVASYANLEMLERTIEDATAVSDATSASIQEIKKKLGLNMNQQRKIPDAQTRARSVAKLQELVKQWDRLIVDIDDLNARLEADIQKNPLTAYRLRRIQKMAQSEEKQE